jgi:aminopeptidase
VTQEVTPVPWTDADTEAMAELLTAYCLAVQPGQQVLVRSTTLAAPLLRALNRTILARGAWPLLRPSLPGVDADFYALAHDAQLDGYPSIARAEAEQADCFLTIQAPENTRALAGVDPERLSRATRSRAALGELRLQKRWCGTLWPTEAGAQQAAMDFDAFAAFVRGALFLDRPDPAAAWRELGAFQAELIARLTPARQIRIEADGTDLLLDVRGRTWANSDGRRNMPSGEVFTGPHETSANGTIRFTVPSSPGGVDVERVELTFRDGEVVGARADRGQEYLERTLATDAGARRLGELGIGTNFGITRPIGAILFDEKIGGTVHLALGRSYPETGGVNASAVHWDLICDLRDGGRLTADGTEIQVDGQFT